MAWLLLFLLVALPFAELAVIVQVAGAVGILDTVALLLIVSLVGVWLAKRAGLGVFARMRQAQLEGRTPSKEVADGALVLLAGGLLLLPGFLSDLVGILLLLPPTRAVVRTLALRQFARRGRVVVVSGRQYGEATGRGRSEIWDVESWEEAPPHRSSGEIGGGS